MATCVISLCSDWPLRSLRFRFHNAQPKCAAIAFNQTICFVHFHCGSGIKKNSKWFASLQGIILEIIPYDDLDTDE